MSEPTTTGVINDVFQNNLDVIVGNFGAVQGTSSSLLIALITFNLLFFFYKGMFEPDEKLLGKFVERVFMLFFVALLTFNWGSVAGFMKGYIAGGGAAIGGGNSMIASMNPAYIASDGLDKVSVIFTPEGQRHLMEGGYFNDAESATRKNEREAQKRKEQAAKAKEKSFAEKQFESFTGVDTSELSQESMMATMVDAGSEIAMTIVVALVFCLLAVMIVLVHFYVSLQLFVLTIDWYLTVAITNLFIPFAANKHTSSLANAGFQAVVRKSVQLGVTMAVLGMFGNTIQGLGLGPRPDMVDVLSLLLGSLTMAFMVKNIPQISNSIFAGGGSTIDLGGTISAASAAIASRAMNVMTGGAGAVAGAASQVGGQAAVGGAKLAGQGALVAGKLAGQGAIGVGKGALAAGQKGADLAKQGAQKLGIGAKDAGPGQRDAEPKTLQELHEMKMKESSHVQNTIEQKEQGPMMIDGSGNVDGGNVPHSSNVQAMQAIPQPQGFQAIDGSSPPPMTGESGTQESTPTQAMHGLARTQQMHAHDVTPSIEVNQGEGNQGGKPSSDAQTSSRGDEHSDD